MGNIVWLASYPKSGNTWVRAFIHNLFRNPERPLPLNELGGGGLTSSEARLDHYRRLDGRDPSAWTADDVAALRLKVHEAIAASVPGTVFCKIHGAVLERHGLPTVNMGVSAGAIYIVRNPLDVALSFADFRGVPVDAAIETMATENLELPGDSGNAPTPLGSWSQHVESWTGRPGPGLHVVRYEDMLASPGRTFRGLAAFLGLEAPRDRLRRALRFSSFRELNAQERKSGFVERSPAQKRFFRAGRAGQWRAGLTARQVRRVVEAHREPMARFGYLPGDP